MNTVTTCKGSLNPSLSGSSHPQTNSHLLSVTIYELAFSRDLYTWKHTVSMYSLLSDLISTLFWDSFMLLQVSTFVFYFKLKSRIAFHDMNMPQFIHPFTHRRTFELFAFRDLTNKAAINLHVQVYAWTCVSFSLALTSRSGWAGSFGRYILIL